MKFKPSFRQCNVTAKQLLKDYHDHIDYRTSLPEAFGQTEAALVNKYDIIMRQAYSSGGVTLFSAIVKDLSRIVGRKFTEMLDHTRYIMDELVLSRNPPRKRMKISLEKSLEPPGDLMSVEAILQHFKATLASFTHTEETKEVPRKPKSEVIVPYSFSKEVIEALGLKAFIFRTRALQRVKIYYRNTFDICRPPTNKGYLLSNRYDSSDVFAKGCDCRDECSANKNCSCSLGVYRMNSYIPIKFAGSTKVLFGKHMPKLIYECSHLCKCDPQVCRMSLAFRHEARPQRQLHLQRRTPKTARKWGVNTGLDIPRNAFICEITGVVALGQDETIEVAKQGDEKWSLSLKHGFGIGGFFGIAEQGNVQCIRVTAFGFTPEKTQVCLFSTKPISSGEELVINERSLTID